MDIENEENVMSDEESDMVSANERAVEDSTINTSTLTADDILDYADHVENGADLTSEEEKLLQETLDDVHKEITPNSPTILIDETTSRFSSAIWYEEIQKKNIILAGLGGIGSYVGYLLARMKPSSLAIFDGDIVDSSNISGQFYTMQDIGVKKSDALISKMHSFADYYSIIQRNRFTYESEGGNIMICGFDSMEARETFYEAWKKCVLKSIKREDFIFIDGRLAAEEFQIFCITGDNEKAMNLYESKYLFPDSKADETICSYKQTSFCANMIASYMVNIFVNFIANSCNPLMERPVPFYTYYSAETMFQKIEEI